ncbi:hypothetical protein BC937DRAFT_91331 [Endogone sp. FLAS-F59071]|nr:hypothetical protein BC937DRAFT_91331 [Endogone sp. FLAS-F59071]|eukprot:RUS16336.1 hypothetical protein BC937DRAFT_91331 [Endogone sp. FLAS-F59071]
MAAALTWLQCALHVLSLNKAPLSAQDILERIIQLNLRVRDTKRVQAPYNTLATALNSEAKKPGGCIMKEGARYKLREKAHSPTTVTNDGSPTKRSRHSTDLGSDDGDSEPESDGGSEMMDIATSVAPVPSGTLSPSSRVAASLDQMRLNDHDSDDDGEIEHLLKSKRNNGLHLHTNGSLTTLKIASASVTSRPHSNNQMTTSKPVTIASTARSSKNVQLAASSRKNHNRVRSLATSSTPADGLISSPALSPINPAPKTGLNGLSRKPSSVNLRVASTAKQSYVAQAGTATATTSSAPPKLNPSVSPSPKSPSRKRPPSPTKPTTTAITTSTAPPKLTPSLSPQKPWNTRPVVATASRNRLPSPPIKSRGSTDRSETEGDHAIEAEDEDENFYPTPSTLKEKRARAVRRAEQLKKWRVREDREARELRAAARRKYVADGNGRTAVQESRESGSVSSGDEKERDRAKSVKFNLRRNIVFEFDGELDGDTDGAGTGNRGGKTIGIVEGVDGVVEIGPAAMEVI